MFPKQSSTSATVYADLLGGYDEMTKPRKGVTSLKTLLAETKQQREQQKRRASDRARLRRYSIDEEDDAARTAAGAALDLENALKTQAKLKELERPEPPSQERCFFPEQAEIAPKELLQSLELSQEELAAVSKFEMEGDSLREEDFLRALLLQGKVLEVCRMQRRCSAATARVLFDLLRAADVSMALSACEALTSMMGFKPLTSLPGALGFQGGWTDTEDDLSGLEDLPIEAFFVDEALHFSGKVAMEWLPSDDQLLAAFHRSGYRSPGAAGNATPLRLSQQSRLSSNKPADEETATPSKAVAKRKAKSAEEGEDTGNTRFPALRALLRFTAALCEHDRQCQAGGASRRGGLRPPGMQQLLCVLLRLGLDPDTAAMSSEIQEATVAILKLYSDKEWRMHLPELAADVCSVGPSHRSLLYLFSMLPSDNSRAMQLRDACCAIVLPCLVPTPAGKVTPAVASLVDIDSLAVVQSLWWTQHSAATKEAVQASFERKATHDVWQLDSALRLANVLLTSPADALYARRLAGDESWESDPLTRYLYRGAWHTTLKELNSEMLKVNNSDAVLVADHAECIKQFHRLRTVQSLV